MKPPQQLKLFDEAFWCRYVYGYGIENGALKVWKQDDWKGVLERLDIRSRYLNQEYFQDIAADRLRVKSSTTYGLINPPRIKPA